MRNKFITIVLTITFLWQNCLPACETYHLHANLRPRAAGERRLTLTGTSLPVPSQREIVEFFDGFDQTGIKRSPDGIITFSSLTRYAPGVLERLISIISELGNKLDILSIGCGRGEMEAMLQKHGHKVLGIDLSEKNVRHTQAKGVNAVVADAHNLPDFGRKFDVVLLSESIGYMNIPLALKNAAAALKDGGRIVVTNYSDIWPIDRALDLRKTKYYRYTRQEVVEGLTQNGFSIISGRTLVIGIMKPNKPYGLDVYIAVKSKRNPADQKVVELALQAI